MQPSVRMELILEVKARWFVATPTTRVRCAYRAKRDGFIRNEMLF